jgi:hypothetical protein
MPWTFLALLKKSEYLRKKHLLVILESSHTFLKVIDESAYKQINSTLPTYFPNSTLWSIVYMLFSSPSSNALFFIYFNCRLAILPYYLHFLLYLKVKFLLLYKFLRWIFSCPWIVEFVWTSFMIGDVDSKKNYVDLFPNLYHLCMLTIFVECSCITTTYN